jgi:type II secretory pathway component GspD/PulD (secretin)
VCVASSYADEVLVTKAFSVKFKELDQVASIVNNLLSDRGAVTMQPKLRTLIVQDLDRNMRRIESAIAAFDQPPPSVEIAVKLVRAEKAAEANPVSDEIKTMAKVGEVLKFNRYSLLGSSVIQSQEGHDAVISLADEYQLSFVTDVIQEGNGIIRLKNLQLKKRKKDSQGKDIFTALMTITLNLRNAETLVLGATRFEDSSQALLLVLRGTVKR